MAELSSLSHARYGKDKVRVLRVVREGSWHHVVEYSVQALLEGDIDVSYTKADNSVVVATDSVKNITYYLAKTSPHILNPERFALHLGTHLVSKYAHIHKAFVTIEQLRWTRIPVETDGQSEPHAHSFYRDGEDKRIVKVEVDATAGKNQIVGKVTAGINDLLILKSTGSAFTNFVRDEYTTLVEVDDRIFSTSVDLSYTFGQFNIPAPKDEKKLDFVVPKAEPGSIWDVEVPEKARKVTLETFATDDSASVQATLYKMAQQIIADNSGIQSVTYTLPNKHYVPVDMKYIGVDNITPLTEAEVFTPLAAPSGLISATISRKQ
ncbi:uricase [Dendrothele bispora CBS 962.96]|uniref:Uricase n=1 Tax=Dendrothele bispora (strain CBS 962.96) TaxID=1314807 RepID=A0A4S8LPV0_DENBC|nr:uricase [Dendrothele bispora CBS 962.96]